MKPDDKIMRLAHKILTQEIWPAKLPKLDDAFDVVFVLIKSLVVSNTVNMPDRLGMIDHVEKRFETFMAQLKTEAGN